MKSRVCGSFIEKYPVYFCHTICTSKHFDIKSKIDELTKKIQENPDLARDFQKDPIKTIESLIGIDLPDDKLQPVIAGVKSRLAATGLGEKLGGLKNLFQGSSTGLFPVLQMTPSHFIPFQIPSCPTGVLT